MDGHGHIIGIDLGTTNSVVAVIEAGEPVVIANPEGQTKTPSVVALLEDGQVLVGDIARRQATTQPQRTVSSVKRLIGRFSSDIQDERDLFPCELGEDEDDRILVCVGDRNLRPEEISAQVLEKLKGAAEEYLGETITRAVVTVPAYFDDNQRQATLEAARLANLEVLRLLNEPTAAAMAYGLGRDQQHTVAVYDFGGGTFDFSILDIDGKTFEVLVSTGDSRLGGDDLDGLLMDCLAEEFLAKYQIDPREDLMSRRRLKEAAEVAKCELSSAYETVVNLPFIAYRDGVPLHLEARLTREMFEELAEPLIRETLDCCANALRQAKVRKTDISKVILVGGSTRIPLVQDMVEDYFGLAPFKGLNPDEIVAIGAATQGAVMNGELDEVVLLDVTPHSLGIEIKGNRNSTLVEKNSTIPLKVEKSFTTTEDQQSFVNIHVLQGDSSRASECRSVGKFTLSGIAPALAGVPRIKVTFFINADGVVEISATDIQSGAAKSLTINHATLSADERRSQQNSDTHHRRHRRKSGHGDNRTKTGFSAASESSRRRSASTRIEATRARPADATPPLPVPAVQAREQLSATFTEIGHESQCDTVARSNEATDVGLPATARSRLEASTIPLVAPTAVAAPAAVGPEPLQNGRRLAECAETDIRPSLSVAAMANLVPSEVLGAGAAEPGPGEALTVRPQAPVPAELALVVEQLTGGQCDQPAAEQYQAAQERFLQFCEANAEDLGLQLLLVRFYIYTKQAEEAREVLERLRTYRPDMTAALVECYHHLCQFFPNYNAARRDRAQLATAAGDYVTAINDLEFVTRREEGSEEVLDQLNHLYDLQLAAVPDPTMQFKQVKLHLRRQNFDAAIALLQQLVTNEEYRDRANKVLGLCFWQKGMRYLAWQKFRELPLDDELKDILYRLADDMEHHDELLNARYALERIAESTSNYKDVAERIRKVSYRLSLQRDERYSGGVPARSAAAGERCDLGNRFEVIEEINRGSMGIVYKARDQILDEIVAIKVLNDFLCQDPQAVERFKLEARSARKLTHLNIVRIHDMFELNNKKIISMEYIEGDNLKTLLARSISFSEEMVFSFLRQICEGLAYAHRLKVVHRDIKPANIMITDQNLVKITDFGIVKVLNERQTKSGTVIMGTPLYMSPEQIEGGPIDHRCDIYSLGIMLYEMVTGNPPFTEGNIEYQHIHHAVPEISVGISDRLRQIISRCIEKRPEDRYQAVEEILAALA